MTGPQTTPSLLDQAVPRYTSYPTAPHFSAAVDANVYRGWLAALDAGATLSLYLHVPYCHDLCLYCGCHTKATRQHRPIAAYAARLAQEIALVARQTGPRKVTHLHWGGGTPSTLGPELLQSLTDELRRHFDLSALREHAIELDPRYLTTELAQALGAIGVNRASLGVQDFDAEVQRAVGRIQPFDRVARAVKILRDAGIGSINLDLMYGLPRQTVEGVRQTAIMADELKPQRIAVFGYAHVPWFRPQQRLIDTAQLPSAPQRLAQAEAAHAILVQMGYQAIGLDHYAQADDPLTPALKSGRLRRNFQGYTVDDADALIGFGSSAIGRLPQGFAQNAPDVAGYSRAISAGTFATVKGIGLTDDDRRRSHIIERLMCDMAVDLSEPESKKDIDFSNALDLLRPLEDNGSLVIDGAHIRITEKGRPYARLVASAFDSYLTRGRARHSAAV